MSILDKIAALTPQRNLKGSDLDLRGSGITKRGLERADASYEREAEKALKSGMTIAAKDASAKFKTALDETIDAIENEAKAKNIILDISQRRALPGVLQNQVSCLIGPAGSGKTTLERLIIAELAKRVNMVHLKHEYNEDENDRDHSEYDHEENDDERSTTPGISVSAFTGRAAQQSRKAIGSDYGIPIQTMHSLLGYAPTLEERETFDYITNKTFMKAVKVFRPSYGPGNKLPYSVYIIDEASMVPINLFNELIDAMHENSRIILIGDIHQLPPVYGKSVLGYALQKWPVFSLDKIHRQAEGNSIIANAHRILNGQMLKKAENFHLLPAPASAGGNSGMALFIRQMTQRLWQTGRFDPYRDVVIVANSDPDIITSAPALNEHFMTMFNEEKRVDGVLINKRMKIHTGTNHVFHAVGDKIMMGHNINTVNPPITNGMMGIVEGINLNGRYDQKRAQIEVDDNEINDPDDEPITLDVDKIHFELDAAVTKIQKEKSDESMDQRQASHVMTIKFETGQTFICSTSGDYRKILFGYAITCHKSQGGEYPNIIIAIHSAAGTLLTQEWLYTAVTRARNNVYLLYNDRGLQKALKTQKIKGKTLAEKIKSYVIETHSDDVALQGDPWNVDRTKYPILFNPKEVEK